MKPRQTRLLAAMLAAGTIAGCASVPGDAGLEQVRTEVDQRSGQSLEWRQESSDSDDPEIRSLLQGELDAERAVAVALRNNPQVQVMLSELGVARADLMEASTIRNPIVSGELRFPARPYHPLEVALAQSLFDLVQLPRRRAAGRALFEASKLRVTGTLLDFAAQVRAEYYGLLAASRHLAMNRAISEAATAAADLAQRQHAAGNINDLDLENEQARYEEAKLDLAQGEAELLARREALIRAMGLRDANLEWTLPSDFPPPPAAESSAQELMELAAGRRLDIAAARSEVEAARRLLPISALRELGDVELDYHFEREPDGTRTAGPGIEVPLPIFNRGRAARTRAEAQLLASRHRLSGLNGAVASQLRSALSRVSAARARVEYYRDVVLPRRKRIVELTLLEHNAMVVGVFQLLQSRQNEANAQRDYIEAQREYWLARNDLDGTVNGVGSFDNSQPTRSASPTRSTGAPGGH